MRTLLLNRGFHPADFQFDLPYYLNLLANSSTFRSIMQVLELDRTYLISNDFRNVVLPKINTGMVAKYYAEANAFVVNAIFDNQRLDLGFDELAAALAQTQDVVQQYVAIKAFITVSAKNMDMHIWAVADLRKIMFGFDDLQDAGDTIAVYPHDIDSVLAAIEIKIANINDAVIKGKRTFLFTTRGTTPCFGVLIVIDPQTVLGFDANCGQVLHVGLLEEVMLRFLSNALNADSDDFFTITTSYYAKTNYPALTLCYDKSFNATSKAMHDVLARINQRSAIRNII